MLRGVVIKKKKRRRRRNPPKALPESLGTVVKMLHSKDTAKLTLSARMMDVGKLDFFSSFVTLGNLI